VVVLANMDEADASALAEQLFKIVLAGVPATKN
jgi:hypothetical protein